MDKTLKAKAISIKGRSYVLVSDRVVFFNESFPNGSIITVLISEPTADHIIVKAVVTPDCNHPERQFADYSQATVGDGLVNKVAALENCSTSAIGRALGLMGIGVIESIASADEMKKAEIQGKMKPLTYKCSDCGVIIAKVENDFSKSKYDRALCRNCQMSRNAGKSNAAAMIKKPVTPEEDFFAGLPEPTGPEYGA